MSTPAAVGLCDECDEKGTQACGGCRVSHYCGKACQKLAWPIHKHLCKSYQQLPPRPTPKHKFQSYTRAILFDPAKPHPQFVWLELQFRYPGYTHPEESSVKDFLDERTKAKLGTHAVCGSGDWFVRNEIMDRQLNHTIEIRFRDEFKYDGSEPNTAVMSIVDPSSKYLHGWRGPIIAFGTDRKYANNQDGKTGFDLTPSDLRHVADFFNGHRYRESDTSPLHAEFQIKRMARKAAVEQQVGKVGEVLVSGVRVNCVGDVDVDKRPKYETFQIPASSSIFQQAATDVSERIELPILVRRISGSVNKWSKRTDVPAGMIGYVNHAGTFLNIGCQPERKNNGPEYAWGNAPGEWQNSVGAVMVVRQDKKPLLPDHVAVLAEYCQFHLSPIFEAQSESERCDDKSLRLGKDHVLKEITKEKFEEYFQAWKTRQADLTKRQVASPYA